MSHRSSFDNSVPEEIDRGFVTLVAGQLVAGWTFGDAGTYAEYISRPATQLVPVPDGLGSDPAVAVVVNYLTAHLAMHCTAKVQRGERILVQRAAGGVGSALLELGRLAGLALYGTASSCNHEQVVALERDPSLRSVLEDLVASPVDEVPEDGVVDWTGMLYEGELSPFGSLEPTTE